MKVYTLENHQFIKAPLKNVFDFFSKPENLKEITPSKLNFKILTPTPISMKEGTLIDYTIKLIGIPLHWRTLITKFDPPNQFIDEQLKVLCNGGKRVMAMIPLGDGKKYIIDSYELDKGIYDFWKNK